MKNILLTVCLLGLWLVYVPARAAVQPEPPQVEFETMEYDFGPVAENSRKVSYDFVFRNTGETPYVITRVITSSCKCISTSHTKRPVPPGGEGVVTVTYDPKKQLGIFYKAIQVFSNAPEGLHILIVKGEVTEAPD
ncbi:MAG: DUF1573 domain-containing protein [Alistipes sp.]|nr:DUF1573 domain-containing protein [Alistipes sp.]